MIVERTPRMRMQDHRNQLREPSRNHRSVKPKPSGTEYQEKTVTQPAHIVQPQTLELKVSLARLPPNDSNQRERLYGAVNLDSSATAVTKVVTTGLNRNSRRSYTSGSSLRLELIQNDNIGIKSRVVIEKSDLHVQSDLDPQIHARSLDEKLNGLTVVQRRAQGRRPFFHYHIDLPLQKYIRPSIKTVEATANAKIFLETYFSTLHTRMESRQQRRLDLECWFQENDMSISARIHHRKEWIAKESAHLRKSRKLKARSRAMTLYARDSTPGGFQILRTLGKGSFGTVCLVREMDGLRTCLPSTISSEELLRSTPSSGDSPGRQHAYRKHSASLLTRFGRSKEDSITALSDSKIPEQCSPAIFAMKVIRKADMLKNSQEGHLRAERDFLVASARSPWVVNLLASFQDNVNLYLVMEYMIGGDFLALLIREDILSERRTRQYVAEMIMCVEAAHNLGWIHRDVKPDNFLISASGHLKIADFGLAFDGHWSHDQNYYHAQRYSMVKKFVLPVVGDEIDKDIIRKDFDPKNEDQGYLLPREIDATRCHDPFSAETTSGCESILEWRDKIGRRAFARSLVGTSQYMAPEIIQGLDYDGRCDYWSIGIILFECLYGHTPFAGKDRDATKEMIVHCDAHLRLPPISSSRIYNTSVSVHALDLIRGLLSTKGKRLGSPFYLQNDVIATEYHGQVFKKNFVYANDARHIKTHSFFDGLDWKRLHELPVKFVPQVRGSWDTCHFDDLDNSMELDLFPESSSDSVVENQQVLVDKLYPKSLNLDGTACLKTPFPKKPKLEAEKLKARPRDRILRDELFSHDAMKLRKRDAFLGYTYRQPPEPRPTISDLINVAA